MRGFFHKLQNLNAKKIIRLLLPKRIDDLLYEIEPGSYKPHQFAEVELEIKKSKERGVLHYDAFVDATHTHRSNLSYDVYLPSQFGYGRFPVIADCFTKPEYRGRKIYPHMLSYIIADLQWSGATPRVFVLVAPGNIASIHGIERAGLQYVARLKGIRIGPFVFQRSGHKKQLSETA